MSRDAKYLYTQVKACRVGCSYPLSQYKPSVHHSVLKLFFAFWKHKCKQQVCSGHTADGSDKVETYSSARRIQGLLSPSRPRRDPSAEVLWRKHPRFPPCNAWIHCWTSQTKRSGDLTANQSRRIAPQGKSQTSFSPQSGFWQNSAGRL